MSPKFRIKFGSLRVRTPTLTFVRSALCLRLAMTALELSQDPREMYVLKTAQWRMPPRLVLNARRPGFDLSEDVLQKVETDQQQQQQPWELAAEALRSAFKVHADPGNQRLVRGALRWQRTVAFETLYRRELAFIFLYNTPGAAFGPNRGSAVLAASKLMGCVKPTGLIFAAIVHCFFWKFYFAELMATTIEILRLAGRASFLRPQFFQGNG